MAEDSRKVVEVVQKMQERLEQRLERLVEPVLVHSIDNKQHKPHIHLLLVSTQ